MTPESFTSAGFEDAEELETLVAGAVAFYRPQNSQEQFAVERIALCQLAILRAYRLESGALTASSSAACQAPPAMTFEGPIDRKNNHALAAGFHQQTKSGPSFSLILRYQAQADRQYRRAVEDFNRLAAARPAEIPNEPISAPEPEETAPLPCLVPPRRDAPTGPRPVSAASPTPTSKPPRREAPGPRREAPRPPAKIEACLPKNINHEIWRHRLSRQQLRSRRVLRRRHQSRAEGGVYLA